MKKFLSAIAYYYVDASFAGKLVYFILAAGLFVGLGWLIRYFMLMRWHWEVVDSFPLYFVYTLIPFILFGVLLFALSAAHNPMYWRNHRKPTKDD